MKKNLSGQKGDIIMIKPVSVDPTLEELLEQITEENRQDKIDFGPPRGKELL